MTTSRADVAEADRQQALLSAAVGQPRSGAVRYAAAMYFYHRGDISAALLEIYRRCCKFDDEDPVDLALFEGIDTPCIATLKS